MSVGKSPSPEESAAKRQKRGAKGMQIGGSKLYLAVLIALAGAIATYFWRDILAWWGYATDELLNLWWIPLTVSLVLALAVVLITSRRTANSPSPSSRRLGWFQRSVIGIDVGNAQIKIVELVPGKPHRVLNHALVPTPRGSVENGIVRDPAALSAAIHEAIKQGGFGGRRAVTALTGQNLMLRNITLPPMPPKELRAAITWQVDSILQLSRDDTVTDYSIAPAQRGDPNKVMIVAMHKEPILNFVDFMQNNGFDIVRVDIEPLAMFRSVLISTQSLANQGTHLICDFGGGTTNLSVFRDGILQTARVVPFGGNQLTRALMVDHGLDFTEAEKVKIEHGFSPDSPYFQSALPIRERLYDEIATTFSFYLTEHKGVEIDSVQLAGGNSLLAGLAEQLEVGLRDALRINHKNFHVARVNPLAHMKHSIDEADLAYHSAALSVAVGLALGEVAE